MSELQRITDYVDAGQALAMAQYQDKPNFNALLAVFLSHCQKIEDALFGLYGGRYLVNPATSGATLDGIGALVGISRNGLPDAAFRVLIYAKIAENNGDATLETLVRITLALFASTSLFEKTPNSIGRAGQNRGAYIAMMVGSPQVPSSLYPLIVRLLKQSLPAGVELAHLGLFNSAGAFAFKGEQSWVQGWGSVKDPSVGAPMGSLLTSSTY